MDTPVQLGKYVITAPLGRGAMGVVYKAFDPNIRRVVALKTIRKDLMPDDSAGLAARFRNEAQAAGRLSHPGIVAVYDYGEEGDIAYIAMEFVEGHDLGDYFKRGVRFDLHDVLSVMVQLLDALGHAHAQGVIHRDIKPANVIITTSGRVKVADFGIARIDVSELTQVGMVMGTPSFMAPEQYLGLAVDGRADVFSAGVVLFQLLTGEKPFQGSYEQVTYRVCHEPTPSARAACPDRVTPELDDVLRKALARDREARFSSAGAFRDALQAAYASPVSSTVSEETRLIDLAGQRARGEATPLPRTPAPAGPGAGASSGSLPPAGWDADVLKAVEGELARFVGPLARILVRKAASGTQNLDSLFGHLAAELESVDDRKAFLARRARVFSTPLPASPGTPTTGARSGSLVGPTTGAGGGLSPETVERAGMDLAPYLGPVGKIVARRAAVRAGTRQQFYLLLAEELEPGDRAKFLHAAGVPG
jgi:eukaryotic-like serine/threonine-protein kinase